MCDKKASKINYGNCLHLSSGTHFMTLSCATRLFNQHITFLPCKGWKKYPSRKPKRHDNLDILREKRRRHKVQTKRDETLSVFPPEPLHLPSVNYKTFAIANS